MSLAAVFITASGILVGADTATLEDEVFGQSRKLETCGPRSVVALTGKTAWRMSQGRGGPVLWAVNSMAVAIKACKAIPPNSKMTVQQQATVVAEALVESANGTNGFPKSAYSTLEGGTILQSIAFAGFDGTTPVVLLTRIALSSVTGTAFVVEDWANFSSDCFTPMGRIRPTLALLRGQMADYSKRSNVLAAQLHPPCSALTSATARSFFMLAVDASYTHAAEFGIVPGSVNWPIDFVQIRASGVGKVERVRPPRTRRKK